MLAVPVNGHRVTAESSGGGLQRFAVTQDRRLPAVVPRNLFCVGLVNRTQHEYFPPSLLISNPDVCQWVKMVVFFCVLETSVPAYVFETAARGTRQERKTEKKKEKKIQNIVAIPKDAGHA